ncbi:MAG: GxxExxY protein [Bacteroidota bacterium]
MEITFRSDTVHATIRGSDRSSSNADERGWARMGTDEQQPKLDDLTATIIGAAFAVSNTLGHGFLEIIYKNALAEELQAQGLAVAKERPYPVFYRDKQMGHYVADIVVEDRVIVELKAVDDLVPAHRAQLLNYLKASNVPIGLLFNFGKPKIQIKRIIL